MLHQSKIYCQCCNSVATTWLCPLPKQWPWSMDILHTSGCAGADFVSPVTVNSKAQWFGTEVYKRHALFIWSVMQPQSGSCKWGWFSYCFQAVHLKGQAGTMGFPGLTSHLPLLQAMPSADGSNGLFLSKSTPCWMRGHCRHWGIPLMSKWRLKMRKRAWRHFV